MNKLGTTLFYFIKNPRNILLLIHRRYCNFFIPNLIFFITKRIVVKKIPSCQQKTKLTGKGSISIGEGCSFGYKLGGFHRGSIVEIQVRYKDSVIKIKNNIATNNNLFICAANYIEVGDNTLIGQGVTIMDFEAHGTEPTRRKQIGEIGSIIIGKNVWIGNNVTILKNSEIGENTIIATGAVVSGKFPKNVIIGGVPAKIIKELE